MQFTPTDLPDPVVPATNTWGIFPRSATTGAPAISCPSASVSVDFESSNVEEANTSLKFTVCRSALGISMPTTLLPGITSTTLTEITARERAKSLAKLDILETFTPAAGCISKRVTTGPGYTATTSATTPKSFNLSSSSRDSDSSSSVE